MRRRHDVDRLLVDLFDFSVPPVSHESADFLKRFRYVFSVSPVDHVDLLTGPRGIHLHCTYVACTPEESECVGVGRRRNYRSGRERTHQSPAGQAAIFPHPQGSRPTSTFSSLSSRAVASFTKSDWREKRINANNTGLRLFQRNFADGCREERCISDAGNSRTRSPSIARRCCPSTGTRQWRMKLAPGPGANGPPGSGIGIGDPASGLGESLARGPSPAGMLSSEDFRSLRSARRFLQPPRRPELPGPP
ncbi:hypothetical protein SAMN04488047_11428 [Tranquillimonas alkanivorans]|uniref:Uncharacterized protein n=1 Tax=Tranquillimonas alkanivorans TaxID=441119 RepID=A0A1I5TM99_9RHOB|nr:hypothetical protein SAMN04488047_11428 [Tranquillimonas alkanivorans]